MKNILLFIGFLSFAGCAHGTFPVVAEDFQNRSKTVAFHGGYDSEKAVAALERTLLHECQGQKPETLKKWHSTEGFATTYFVEFRCIP